MLDAIWSKSELGRVEIETRALRLKPALRMVLLLVDGSRNTRDLADLSAQLHAPEGALQELEALGLVVRSDLAVAHGGAALSPAAERFRVLYGLMSESVREYLGLRGYFMQVKVERCADVAELQALLPALADAIGKARGDAVGRRWRQGVEAAVATR